MELRANEWKGDYTKWPKDTYHNAMEIAYHAAKLFAAMVEGNKPAIMEFAADVGNCAMFAAKACDALHSDYVLMESADYSEGGSVLDPHDKDVLMQVSREFARSVCASLGTTTSMSQE